MPEQPKNTIPAIIHPSSIENAEDATPALLVHTAQQAVLPRQLDEGIYAILDADGAVQIVETDGYKAQREHDWAAAHAPTPERIKRHVTVLDVHSFIDYLERHHEQVDNKSATGPTGPGLAEDYAYGTGLLEVWADLDARTIKATLDGIDGWRQHTATLQLKLSREWTEWAGIDGKLLPQVEFAQFIEDHLSTIAEPDGAKLMDICQTLEVAQSAQFKQQSILANGQRVFRYEENVEAKAGQKGDLTIPGTLTLVLRPFQGGAGVPITARFRYQLRDGALRIGVKLAEPDLALEDAFAAVVRDVQARVPVPVLFGRP